MRLQVVLSSVHIYMIKTIDLTTHIQCHIESLAELVREVGFEVIEDSYVQKETVNVKEGIAAPRVFIQGKFLKPT